MPLQKNQVLTLTIERLSNDGSGVAHSPDGEAVFVPGTAPGDEADIRIVKDIYPPRMTLRFVVKGADGQVLAEGERKLVDHGFLTGTNVNSNDSLRYEKRLIDDWLRREFKDNAALTATR